MNNKNKFISEITSGYTFKTESITMGGAMIDGDCINNLHVKVPLKTLNRHGLIAGATGTGKTKTLQVLTEGLSDKGIPVLVMDVKGDLSGLARPGSDHPKISERHDKIGLPFRARRFPVEIMTISAQPGTRLRATISEFGPVLLSKILGLNDTQGGIVSLLFKYCDDHGLLLLDLKDFKKILNYATAEGKAEIEKEYGAISTTSVSTILRKIIELEQQDAELFFGERSFEIQDLLRTDREGLGFVSILRINDIQDKPKLFSTFMLCLLAEIYTTLPEVGDQDKPKLVLFIDEAHLIFDEASKALLNQLETVIKLIRSKGVGIFFCTQNPGDVPASVLSQLGLKIQHALRAFTAKDRKMIKLAAENYPISEYYKTDEMLTSLGIGEAAISCLNEKGIPTPLVSTLLVAPRSRMDILNKDEINTEISNSEIAIRYNENIDRESAYEILNKKIDDRQPDDLPEETGKSPRSSKEKSALEQISKNTMVRQLGRTIMREVVRGLLGVLGVKAIRSRTVRRR